MSVINGYSIETLIEHYFSHITTFTATNICDKLGRLRDRLRANTSPIFLSIGENCGPGTRMRGAGMNTLGSNFFDNIVISPEALPALLRSDFSDILSLRNLRVSSWEGQDSVLDEKYGIFFHHYFYIRGLEKQHDAGTRRIDEEDIPLFLPPVRAQFEYLAEKFRLIMRHEILKFLIVRRVNGDPVSEHVMADIDRSLRGLGATNFRIAQIVSSPCDGCILIPEHEIRWGDAQKWRVLLSEYAGLNPL